jgi:hypothetical protein
MHDASLRLVQESHLSLLSAKLSDDVGISNNPIVLKFSLLPGFSFIEILMSLHRDINR